KGQEMPGVSAFYKDADGAVFRTYSTYGRGVEVMMHTYRMLDLTAKGRDEDGLDFTMAWVRHHDRYELAPVAKPVATPVGACCGRCPSGTSRVRSGRPLGCRWRPPRPLP